MKKILVLLFAFVALFGCKKDAKQEKNETSVENIEQPKDELIKFNSERLFYGMLYEPGSQVFNHFTECDQNNPMSFVISGGEGYDDFMKQFSTKHHENYLNTEWVKVEFKGYVTETKQKVDKGELYTVVMTEILFMDLDSQCK